MIYLILGGARSGKSSYAENLAKELAVQKFSGHSLDALIAQEREVIYIATAEVEDNEMEKRVSYHQQSRPQDWKLIEESLYLSDCVTKNANDNVLIIECMTLWLTNWLCHSNAEHWPDEKNKFIHALQLLKENQRESDIIIVSNEVGSGIVPMGELSREFVDQAGWLNQMLSTISDKVTLVVAGCPLTLKS